MKTNKTDKLIEEKAKELEKQLADKFLEWEKGNSNLLLGAFRVDARVKSVMEIVKPILRQSLKEVAEAERLRILEELQYESIYFLPGSMVTVEGIDKDGNRYKAQWMTREDLEQRLTPQKEEASNE